MFTPAPQKILIVDDSQANLMLLCDTLSEHDCIPVSSGEEALKNAFSDTPPDLILLDIIMKGMNGYEVCSLLKKDSRTKEIPVIFITGDRDTKSLVKGFNVGAIDFITKPFNFDELKVRVSTQLKYKKMLDDNNRYLKSIEEIYDTVTDSIYYAQRIQQATLPHDSFLNTLMIDYFVFYRPRDIVSGDFYLACDHNNMLLLVAADCTGHGVPGALMSMMSMAFIKEIINVENITEPHQILNKLRKTIISTFYTSDSDEISDGLDASIALIDFKNNILKFSGANLPLFIIRDSELTEIKGNRMPVGAYPKQNPFTSKTLPIKKNDCIYIFTDGYTDQFGGPKDRKMMNYNFKKLLVNIYDNPMSKQKTLIEDYFNEWKGYTEQVDDILVMGYRFNQKDFPLK